MKLVYIPLDERPCNYHFAEKIARGTPIELRRPAREILGNKKTPADFSRLRAFMLENASRADGYVVSLDMLLYGGIVPSRLHHLSREELTQRLAVLDEIKAINPDVKIYGFALIMRCPRYSSADEEPSYYEHCGREIFLTGQVKHKQELGLLEQPQAQALLEQYAAVTGDALSDYERRRQVNRQMLLEIIEKLHSSIDYLVIPQDDSAQYGYTTMDREAIKAEIRRKGLEDVAMYPGADEVGMTLTARAACEYMNRTPKIYCDFTREEARQLTPLYEDRPVGLTLPYQIDTAGCACVSRAEEADIHLFLNYPTAQQLEVWEASEVKDDRRNLDAFTDRMTASVRAGRVTALADGGFCNGGDEALMLLVENKLGVLNLSAYAGWNTSSNTLGTVICQAVFVFLFGDSREQKCFLAERICEDVGYCGHVRKYVTDCVLPEMNLNYFDAGSVEGDVSKRVREELENYLKEKFPPISERYSISHCAMPWKRMFEVELSMKERAQ